ncbi:MAG: hypothetical protein PVG01_07955, partial [Desulfobacterales bacterium]
VIMRNLLREIGYRRFDFFLTQDGFEVWHRFGNFPLDSSTSSGPSSRNTMSILPQKGSSCQ